jgi:hypothetical protein
MKTRRLLIAAFVFLATGSYLLFGYCNGTTGFSTGYPISGSSLKLDITTTGFPAIGGMLLTVFGLLILVMAVIAAIGGEVQSVLSRKKSPTPEESAKPASL